jgi:hypothetical protein
VSYRAETPPSSLASGLDGGLPRPGQGPAHVTVIEVIAGGVHDHDDLQPLVEVPAPGVSMLPSPLDAGRDVNVHAWGPVDLKHLCALRN